MSKFKFTGPETDDGGRPVAPFYVFEASDADAAYAALDRWLVDESGLALWPEDFDCVEV